MNRPDAIRIAESDNVAVALRLIAAGETIAVGGESITVGQEVQPGHKIALHRIAQDEQVIKYGVPIGLASAAIERGDWVHSHNLRTALSGLLGYGYRPAGSGGLKRVETGPLPTFRGYRRANGKAGTRNELWVLNTVGCVNHAANRIAKQAAE